MTFLYLGKVFGHSSAGQCQHLFTSMFWFPGFYISITHRHDPFLIRPYLRHQTSCPAPSQGSSCKGSSCRQPIPGVSTWFTTGARGYCSLPGLTKTDASKKKHPWPLLTSPLGKWSISSQIKRVIIDSWPPPHTWPLITQQNSNFCWVQLSGCPTTELAKRRRVISFTRFIEVDTSENVVYHMNFSGPTNQHFCG